MMRWIGLLLALLVVGCGSSPSAPSPVPVPTPAPAPAPAPTPAPIIQPDPAQFDATFNAQFVHDALESSPVVRAQLLHTSPAIYLQTAGLDPSMPSQLEAEARAIVPMLSGGMLSVASFTAAPDLHPLQAGAIVVQIMPDTSGPNCGLTDIGAQAGYIRLYIHIAACTRGWVDVFGHELGHALGFYHVADPACLMSVSRPITHNGAPCDKERYHAGLAYQSNGAYRVLD